jgi:phospholipase D1/2
MAGKPFKVGRFAHSLRVRLMREHIGLDVDALCEEDLITSESLRPESDQQPWDPDAEQAVGAEGVTRVKSRHITPVGGLFDFALEGTGQGEQACFLYES